MQKFMKKSWKPGTMVYPIPAVMVSCGATPEEYNIMTAAWTGTICSEPAMCYVSIRPERHSYDIVKRTGEFVINLVPASLARSADYCGIYTGAKVDKFKKCGLTASPIEGVSVPAIEECPISIACRVTDIIPMGTHDMFLADVVSVEADEALFDERGALHLEKASLCAYVHGAYFKLGAKIGTFGFSAAKKKKKRGNATHGKSKD